MIKSLLKWLHRVTAEKPAVQATPAPRKKQKISDAALVSSRKAPQPTDQPEKMQHQKYEPPKGVVPAAEVTTALAMDQTPYDLINGGLINSALCEGDYFPGYPYLAMLMQRPEYRKMSETIAEETTRKWITFHAVGQDDKAEKIKIIEQELIKYNVRDLFRRAMELDGFFGRGQIYIDVNMPDSVIPARTNAEELNTILLRDKAKITKGCLRGFNLVEPVWTYPSNYNTTDPLAPDYYKPTSWYVMGKKVHASRLLMFISREVPDLLKASYNFGGISLSQLAKPYVDNWIRTRDSVSETIHTFSTSGIETNMGDVLSGAGAEEIYKRAELFNNLRDNRGLLLLDNSAGTDGKETFFQSNVPLGGLDGLQAQAMEQLPSIAGIPLVKYWGITPSGLNASSEGEIEVFDDHMMSKKRNVMAGPLTDIINIIQLNKFGEIDPDITHDFDPMAEMSEVDRATIRKTDAETDAVLIGSAVISPDDARERLINDPDSGYTSLEANEDLGDNDDEDDAEPGI